MMAPRISGESPKYSRAKGLLLVSEATALARKPFVPSRQNPHRVDVIVVITPSGYRIEGLALEQVVALLRDLA